MELAVINQPMPMLCETVKMLPDDGGWIFEWKLDGGRAIAVSRNGRRKLFSRSGNDLRMQFPEIERDLAEVGNVVLDGEIVVFDGDGVDDINLYQQRALIRNKYQVEKRSVALPAFLMVFDLLAVEGKDLTYQPLLHRKAELKAIIPPTLEHIRVLPWHETPQELLGRMDIEGVVAKRRDSIYEGKRSNSWVKYRFMEEADVLAVDYEVTRKGIVCMDEEGHRFNINGRLGWEAKAILDEDGKIVLEVEYSRKTGLGQAAGRFRFPAVKRIRRVE